jgi:hypothetical protein
MDPGHTFGTLVSIAGLCFYVGLTIWGLKR